jgi:hypothetical protein
MKLAVSAHKTFKQAPAQLGSKKQAILVMLPCSASAQNPLIRSLQFIIRLHVLQTINFIYT